MSKDTISVNMNVYDIPIVVEQLKKLEQALKDIEEILLNEEQPIQPSNIRYDIFKIIEKALGEKQ